MAVARMGGGVRGSSCPASAHSEPGARSALRPETEDYLNFPVTNDPTRGPERYAVISILVRGQCRAKLPDTFRIARDSGAIRKRSTRVAEH